MMPVWIGKIERDKGAADIRQSLSMRNNICGRHCSLELSFYRFLSTSGHTTGHPQCPARRHPAFRSSPGGLRRRASVGRQSVLCSHTHSLSETPTVRSSPRLPLLSELPCLCCGQSRDFRLPTFIMRYSHL